MKCTEARWLIEGVPCPHCYAPAGRACMRFNTLEYIETIHVERIARALTLPLPEIEFWVAGAAVPQPRAGPGRGGHMIMAPDASGIRVWRSTLRAMAQIEMQDRAMLTGPIRLMAQFIFKRPKRLGDINEIEKLLHDQRPDWDNLGKAVSDAFKLVVWDDDGRVSTAIMRKRFAKVGEKPGALVRVYRDWAR